jgi:hypothetical protein
MSVTANKTNTERATVSLLFQVLFPVDVFILNLSLFL